MTRIQFSLSSEESLQAFRQFANAILTAAGEMNGSTRAELDRKATDLQVHEIDATAILDEVLATEAVREAFRRHRSAGSASDLAGTWSVRILHSFDYNGQPIFGLDVAGPAFPRVVGCSLRTTSGRIIDIPARRLRTAGHALWPVSIPDKALFLQGENPIGVRHCAGEVIFALWDSDRYERRLADTGWVRWDTNRVPDNASHYFLKYVEGDIDSAYGDRADAWDKGDVSEALSAPEADALLRQRARELGWNVAGNIEPVGPTPFGTVGFVLLAGDDKAALFCHASGARCGRVFEVHGGIGWCYLARLGAATGFLGLPVSDERPVEGGARSDFEAGYVEWRRQESTVFAYQNSGTGHRLLHELRV